jgi:hypothetical protein
MRVVALLAVTLLVSGANADSTPAKGGSVHSQRAACALLKRRVSELDKLPVTGPPGIGWYCDFIPSGDKDLYAIGLRSGRICPEICSNLMGWYAVRKSSGEVGRFDITDQVMKPLGSIP